MQELQAEQADFETQVGDVKTQAEEKTRQLKRLYANYQAKKSEAADLNYQFQVRLHLSAFYISALLPGHTTGRSGLAATLRATIKCSCF
jgi:hypothetical protein